MHVFRINQKPPNQVQVEVALYLAIIKKLFCFLNTYIIHGELMNPNVPDSQQADPAREESENFIFCGGKAYTARCILNP